MGSRVWGCGREGLRRGWLPRAETATSAARPSSGRVGQEPPTPHKAALPRSSVLSRYSQWKYLKAMWSAWTTNPETRRSPIPLERRLSPSVQSTGRTGSAQATPAPTLPLSGSLAAGSLLALPQPSPARISITGSGSRDRDRNSADKWRLCGPRSLWKSDPEVWPPSPAGEP